MDHFLDHYLHDFLLTFWQFLERFLVILGTKYEACLGGSLAILLPTIVPRLVVPWVVCPVHAAVRRVLLWALELARGPDM